MGRLPNGPGVVFWVQRGPINRVWNWCMLTWLTAASLHSCCAPCNGKGVHESTTELMTGGLGRDPTTAHQCLDPTLCS